MAYLRKNPEAQRELQIEVKTQSQWDSLISSDGLIVVDAYAGWCGPCTAIVSTFRKIKNETGDQMLKFATAVTENVESLTAYKGHSKPTFLFYGGGELVNVVRGCKAPQLIKDITDLLELEHRIMEGKADRSVFIDPEVSQTNVKPTEDQSIASDNAQDDTVNEEDEEIADAMTVRMSKSKISLSSVEVSKEISMVIVKPDAVKEGLTDEIIDKITHAGMEIIQKSERLLSRDEVENLYTQHKDMDYFDELVDFMTSDNSIILLVCKYGNDSGQGVIEELRDLLGPRDVSLARQEAPESLRAKYGTDTIRNALHACDSGESAARELAFFFPEFNAPKVLEKRKKVQLQRTLALIRPGALHRKDSILERVKEAGFVIAMSKELQLSREQAESFYNEHRGSEHFDSLVDHMTSGPCMALCLAREEAVSAWRELIGPKDVKEAKEAAPESLRAVFADDGVPVNPLHGADCEQAAKNEIEQIFPMQSTIAVIKPDAYNEPQQKEAIINKIKDAGFKISAQKEINLTKELASQFYKEHEGKEFYDDLTNYMSSGPTLFMVLSREDAVEGFRAVLGPTDPETARSMAPTSLRALHAKDSLHNAIHGSSNPEKAKQIIDNFFTPDELTDHSQNQADRKTSSISTATNEDTVIDNNLHGVEKGADVLGEDVPVTEDGKAKEADKIDVENRDENALEQTDVYVNEAAEQVASTGKQEGKEDKKLNEKTESEEIVETSDAASDEVVINEEQQNVLVENTTDIPSGEVDMNENENQKAAGEGTETKLEANTSEVDENPQKQSDAETVNDITENIPDDNDTKETDQTDENKAIEKEPGENLEDNLEKNDEGGKTEIENNDSETTGKENESPEKTNETKDANAADKDDETTGKGTSQDTVDKTETIGDTKTTAGEQPEESNKADTVNEDLAKENSKANDVQPNDIEPKTDSVEALVNDTTIEESNDKQGGVKSEDNADETEANNSTSQTKLVDEGDTKDNTKEPDIPAPDKQENQKSEEVEGVTEGETEDTKEQDNPASSKTNEDLETGQPANSPQQLDSETNESTVAIEANNESPPEEQNKTEMPVDDTSLEANDTKTTTEPEAKQEACKDGEVDTPVDASDEIKESNEDSNPTEDVPEGSTIDADTNQLENIEKSPQKEKENNIKTGDDASS